MISLIFNALTSIVSSQVDKITSLKSDMPHFLKQTAKVTFLSWLFDTNMMHDGRRIRTLSISGNGTPTIPIVYGTMNLFGNLIWASEIQECKNIHKISDGHRYNQYYYTVTLVFAICEGQIDGLEEMKINGSYIDFRKENIAVYHGSDTQMPDPTVQSYLHDDAPAYRGLAYVVIKDYALHSCSDFQVPEVSFRVKNNNLMQNSTESMVNSIVMLPGSGEFVYDTAPQYKALGEILYNGDTYDVAPIGEPTAINQHQTSGSTNSVVSLNNLETTLPNVEWIAVTVNWFSQSLDIGSARITPGVEFCSDYHYIIPEEWQVADCTRPTMETHSKKFTISNEPLKAHVIGKDKNQNLRYGGTPSDKSLIRYLTMLKKRGYKILLYPLLLIDTLEKPWRGRLSGDVNDVPQFFHKERGGYNKFILHYAKIAKEYADAFIIGSEMVALNAMQNDKKEFVAVKEFAALAKNVKSIVGDNVKVTYAADWSEYHHNAKGFYHLDDLWASDAIDFIGIDAYFPLTDWNNDMRDVNAIKKGWQSGEGYDFYYCDDAKSIKEPLSPEYAWKNIEWWWKNEHVNPDGAKTKWHPKSKKIWFTEYGFPSVHLCTNQPNVFCDENSIESHLPIYSNGNVDFISQRNAIRATEEFWYNSEFVERKFLWCWDARPFPIWPSRNDVWGDASAWKRGHWVQGKLGTAILADIIHSLCLRAGLSESDFVVDGLLHYVNGMSIQNEYTIYDLLHILKESYAFDMFEDEGIIKFRDRKDAKLYDVSSDHIISSISGIKSENLDFKINALNEAVIPQTTIVNYLNAYDDNAISSANATRKVVKNNTQLQINMPISIDEIEAQRIAHNILGKLWAERFTYSFSLPLTYAADLRLSDIVSLNFDQIKHTIKITEIRLNKSKIISFRGVSNSADIGINHNAIPLKAHSATDIIIPDSHVEMIDIPFISPLPTIFFAASGYSDNWYGCNIQISIPNGYEQFDVTIAATMGRALCMPATKSCTHIDFESKIIITLSSNKLRNINIDKLFENNAENLAILGDEVIRFADVERISDNVCAIKTLLRGLYGTESVTHKIGERFVLLNSNLHSTPLHDNDYSAQKFAIDVAPLSANHNNDICQHLDVKFTAQSTLPLSVCNVTLLKNIDHIAIDWTPRLYSESFLIDNISEQDTLKDMAFNVSVYSESGNIIYNSDVFGRSHYEISDDIIIEKCFKVSVASYRKISDKYILGHKVYAT